MAITFEEFDSLILNWLNYLQSVTQLAAKITTFNYFSKLTHFEACEQIIFYDFDFGVVFSRSILVCRGQTHFKLGLIILRSFHISSVPLRSSLFFF